jgi:hypothetical protein
LTGRHAAGLELLQHIAQKLRIAQRLSGEVNVEAPQAAQRRGRQIAQGGKRRAHHPAIDGRHQVVAFGGRQEGGRRDDMAIVGLEVQ